LGFRAEVSVLKRLRLADQLPVAVETSYLNYDLCKDLMREELSGKSLYHLLATRLNIVPTRARQQLEAIPCPPAEARLLALRKGRRFCISIARPSTSLGGLSSRSNLFTEETVTSFR